MNWTNINDKYPDRNGFYTVKDKLDNVGIVLWSNELGFMTLNDPEDSLKEVEYWSPLMLDRNASEDEHHDCCLD